MRENANLGSSRVRNRATLLMDGDRSPAGTTPHRIHSIVSLDTEIKHSQPSTIRPGKTRFTCEDDTELRVQGLQSLAHKLLAVIFGPRGKLSQRDPGPSGKMKGIRGRSASGIHKGANSPLPQGFHQATFILLSLPRRNSTLGFFPVWRGFATPKEAKIDGEIKPIAEKGPLREFKSPSPWQLLRSKQLNQQPREPRH